MIQISSDLREYSKLAEEVKAVAELDDLTNIAEELYVAGKITEFNEQVIQRKPHYKELCDVLLDRLYNIIIKGNRRMVA